MEDAWGNHCGWKAGYERDADCYAAESALESAKVSPCRASRGRENLRSFECYDGER